MVRKLVERRRRGVFGKIMPAVFWLANGFMALWLFGTVGFAHAASSDDETFANAALRELHKLAAASAQSDRAAKDSDRIGCRDSYDSLQKAAHEALTNMHYMSFAPIDALERVSSLLRVSNLSPGECPGSAMQIGILPMLAGQAIVGLRIDYAIGDGDWYMISASGTVEAKNPLRYAQSLSDQRYSWVDVRAKGVLFIGVSDWKAEMASFEVSDPAIENSGNSLKTVEVGYRKSEGDKNTEVYFYRTREDAQTAAQAAREQAESDAKAAAQTKASIAEWRQKLLSLPYMVANRDAGFKLTSAICKPAGTNAQGQKTCVDDDFRDWSDSRASPYRWFENMEGCEDAEVSLKSEHFSRVEDPNGSFMTYCVPAPKVSGRVLKGYKLIFALTTPEGESSADKVYADLRERGTQAAMVFKTFKACHDAMDAPLYSKMMKDLGANENGELLNDETKSIDLTANCVRIY